VTYTRIKKDMSCESVLLCISSIQLPSIAFMWIITKLLYIIFFIYFEL